MLKQKTTFQKILIGAAMSAVLAGATSASLLVGCSTDDRDETSDVYANLSTKYQGKDYPMQIADVQGDAKQLVATIQLVGGPTFTLTAKRDASGRLTATLDGGDVSYALDISDKLVSSVYTTSPKGVVRGNQMLWALPSDRDPSHQISIHADPTAGRVFAEQTPHGTLVGALQAIAAARPDQADLLATIETNVAQLVPTARYAAGVLEANRNAALPDPVAGPVPLATACPDPTTDPTAPADPTPTPTTDPSATPDANPSPGPAPAYLPADTCGHTCNVTKSGSADGPAFDINIGSGLVKLGVSTAHADLSATFWNDAPTPGIDAKGGGGTAPIADGISCVTNGKPNGWTWEHQGGTVWADAAAKGGTCHSANDPDHATAGDVKFTIDGIGDVKGKACNATCDGIAHTRAEITGEASGCFRKNFWGNMEQYFATGSASTACTCN